MQCKIPLRARARASTGTEFVSLALAEVKRLELTANLKVKSASIPMRGAQDAVSEWRASGERVASERPTSDQRATNERPTSDRRANGDGRRENIGKSKTSSANVRWTSYQLINKNYANRHFRRLSNSRLLTFLLPG